MRKEIRLFDEQLRSTFDKIVRHSLPDDAWAQATLPFSMGGLGLSEASQIADAAFVSSCIQSKPISDDIGAAPDLFQGEREARERLGSVLSNFADKPLSQPKLITEINTAKFSKLVNNCDIRNKARLLALSSSFSSAWLKAVPTPSLGLAIPGPEFLVALHQYLGLPILTPTSNVRCACSSIVDLFGDHWLGCGVGPHRTGRHNALRDVIFSALQQDCPTVRKEQLIGGDTLSRPGDIYHPSFCYGKPTFFDVSVVSTLQPVNVNRASSSVGELAVQVEASKDAKYREQVEAKGGVFVPLVVETLGVWTPYGLAKLRDIAAKTTLRSGLELATAFNNFIQCLSVCLWCSNAKLILYHLSSLCVSPIWDVVPV